MKNRFLNIRNELILTFLFVICVPEIIGIIFVSNKSMTLEKLNFIDSTNKEIRRIDNNFKTFLEASNDNCNYLANDPLITNAIGKISNYTDLPLGEKIKMTPSQNGGIEFEIYKKFDYFIKNYPDFSCIFMGFEDGGYLQWPEESTTRYDPRGRSWYKETINHKDQIVHINPYSIQDYPNTIAISTLKTIKNDEGNTIGVLGIDISIPALTKFVQNIKIGDTGYLMLIDSQNNIIIDPKNSNNNFKKISILNIDKLNDISNIDTTDFEVKMNDKNYIIHVATSSYTKWKYVSFIEKEELIAKIIKINHYHIFVALSSLFIGIIFSIFISKRISKNINYTLACLNEIDNCNINHDFHPKIISRKDEIGTFCNVAIKNIQKRIEKEKEILYLSYHDQLTGLYNRRFYEEHLKRLDAKQNLPLSIVMGDVNGLKLINDSFGHITGDDLLKKVAQLMTNGCRPGDIIARLGGDEFVIILPKTNSSETEQIINNIKNLASYEKVNSIDISISFGHESKKKMEEDIQEVFKKAEDYMYKKKLFESKSINGKTIKAIINTLHEKNKREEQHSHRVSVLCKKMGESLGLTEEKIEELKTVGLLHDIGKIAIDENILNKPDKLTDNEWNEIKLHPEIGYRILNTASDLSEIAEYVLHHHEKWDGSGYPKGLKGKDIPFISRIIAIVDAYDAMTSERSYRKGLSTKIAIDELQKNAGIQFDPELVNTFIKNLF